MSIDQNIKWYPVIGIHGDNTVLGYTNDKYSLNFLSLMHIFLENTLVFNSVKSDIWWPEIVPYGWLLTSDGTKPNLSKVKGIAVILYPIDFQKF